MPEACYPSPPNNEGEEVTLLADKRGEVTDGFPKTISSLGMG